MAEKKQNANDENTGAIIRRRLIGAAAMLFFAFVLWHLGESAPPPGRVTIESPVAEEWQTPGSEVLQDAGVRLAKGDAVLENIENAAGDEDNGGAFADGDAIFVDEEVNITLAAEVADTIGGEAANAVNNINNAIDNNNNADGGNNETETANGEKDTPTVAVAEVSTQPDNENADTGISFSAGVFGIAKNADVLAAKIKAAGWQTTIHTYQKDGKTLHKVLVVHLADNNAKAKAQSAVEKLATTPPPKTSNFVVQIGAFARLSKAKDIAKKLNDDGYAASISEVNRSGDLLYRVRITGYQTRADAEEAIRNLRASGYDANIIDLR